MTAPVPPSDASAPAGPELTLDPDDWEAMRALGHRMVDDMLQYSRTLRDRPVWRPIPDAVRQAFAQPIPLEGVGPDAAYAACLRYVFPHPYGNIHPRFWGWVNGTGSPLGALTEMLAATINPNVHGGQSAAVLVEEQVLAWLRQALGMPEGTSGVLVSGASMANFIGLAIALHAQAPFDVARDGLPSATAPLVFYTSVEAHHSIEKAVRLLGLGAKALRRIPVDAAFRVRLSRLRAAIRADRRRGYIPIGIIGTAGTVNTGATDDLDALADVAAQEALWFHVDGAFGALAALHPRLRDRVRGLGRADSLAFDLHKWLFTPIEAGAILIRNPRAHRVPFAVTGDYLTPMIGGISVDAGRFGDRGLQLTRAFRALKVWMTLTAYGITKHADIIAQNVDQAAYLARRVAETPVLELLAPVPLNIVCFRYLGGDVAADACDELNRALLVTLQESGNAVLSHTRLAGRFALRAAITNHRTRREDLDFVVAEVVRIGDRLCANQGTIRTG